MNPTALFMDTYERKARLYPALLLIAPVVATGAAVLAARMSVLQSIATLVLACGGALLLSQLARDAGKKGEQDLFKKWGGTPSVAIFRHRDGKVDSITKARYHARLATLVDGTKAPTVGEEQADQAAADRVYTAWSNYLRVRTRDTKRYALLFNENVNYGYRRNVWGLRTVGIVSCTACCLISGTRLYQLHRATGVVSEEITGALALTLGFLALWVFRFSAEWVRVPAYAYAERLAEIVETLGPQPTTQDQ